MERWVWGRRNDSSSWMQCDVARLGMDNRPGPLRARGRKSKKHQKCKQLNHDLLAFVSCCNVILSRRSHWSRARPRIAKTCDLCHSLNFVAVATSVRRQRLRYTRRILIFVPRSECPSVTILPLLFPRQECRMYVYQSNSLPPDAVFFVACPTPNKCVGAPLCGRRVCRCRFRSAVYRQSSLYTDGGPPSDASRKEKRMDEKEMGCCVRLVLFKRA